MTVGKRITVMFMDETGKVFAHGDFPPESLPESFKARTTMEIHGQNWDVLKAEPLTREQAQQSGQLSLTLRKVEKIAVGNIFYSTPSISDDLPSMQRASTKEGKRPFSIPEDDWRGIELISDEFVEVAKSELQQIERIHQECRVGNTGWREIHVRKNLPLPLSGRRINRGLLESAFKLPLHPFDGLTFHGTNGMVENGFAFKDGQGLIVYGLMAGDEIKVLCIDPSQARSIESAGAERLATFLNTNHLVLVRWNWLKLVTDEAGLMTTIFTRFKG